MNKKFLVIILFVMSICVGCNKIYKSKTLIKGQNKLESHQYDEAMNLLSKVLDDEPENEKARKMYMQARKMNSAQKFEDNNDYNKAIKELDSIINVENGSNKIKRESINKKKELEKLKEKKEKHLNIKR